MNEKFEIIQPNLLSWDVIDRYTKNLSFMLQSIWYSKPSQVTHITNIFDVFMKSIDWPVLFFQRVIDFLRIDRPGIQYILKFIHGSWIILWNMISYILEEKVSIYHENRVSIFWNCCIHLLINEELAKFIIFSTQALISLKSIQKGLIGSGKCELKINLIWLKSFFELETEDMILYSMRNQFCSKGEHNQLKDHWFRKKSWGLERRIILRKWISSSSQ